MSANQDRPSRSMPVFRTEAVQQAQNRRYGAIILASPLSSSLLASFGAMVSICLIVFFTTFEYQRKVNVPGVLLPESGLVRVVAPITGTVRSRNVQDGQAVSVGDALFMIANERFSARRGDVEMVTSDLLEGRHDSLVTDRAQLQRQAAERSDALRTRVNDLSREMARIDEQIALQKRRIGISELTLKRVADLQADSFVSPAQVQDKQGELLDQQQRMAELQRLRSTALREQDAARAELRDGQIQAERDDEVAARSIASTAQDQAENEARRELLVRAPQDGIVTALNAQTGQPVTAGVSLAYILPKDGRLFAELYVESRAAGFLKQGMSVLLRFHAYPYQKFGQHHGQVIDISSSAMRPEELVAQSGVQLNGANGEPMYRLHVALDEQEISIYGKRQALKPGMLLDASILLERRPLYQWILEPLYTITGRM